MKKRREAKPLQLTGIRLENWKNFKKASVPIGRRVFLVGPNAAGKSNFLDALRFLQNLVSVGGGLQSAIERRRGVSQIRSLSASRYPSVLIAVDLAREETGENWAYELRFTQDNNRVPIVESEVVVRNGTLLLERPDDHDRKDRARLTQTALQQVNENFNFREIVDFFRSIRYLHVVPQLIREPDRSIGRSNDPFGGDFLESLARTSKRTLESRLNKIAQALRVAIPQLESLTLERDSIDATPHLRGKYKHWRGQGAWQNEEQFSDGTLRLIGLLWALLDGQGPLLLEEPELSLNGAVVRALPQLFARMQQRSERQIILSTHSSEMFFDSGVDPTEVLVITPTTNGSQIERSNDLADVNRVLEAREPLAEALRPVVAPPDISQLPLFALS